MSKYKVVIVEAGNQIDEFYDVQRGENGAYTNAMRHVRRLRSMGLDMKTAELWANGPRFYRRWESSDASGNECAVEILDR